MKRILRALLQAIRYQVEADLRQRQNARYRFIPSYREIPKDTVTQAEQTYANWHGLSYFDWLRLPSVKRQIMRNEYFQANNL